MNKVVLAIGHGQLKLNAVHPEDRALLGSNLSAALGPKTAGRGGLVPPWHASLSDFDFKRSEKSRIQCLGFSLVPLSNSAELKNRGLSQIRYPQIRPGMRPAGLALMRKIQSLT
jgi:hypothetical protein